MKKIIFLTTLCLSLTTGATFAQNFGGGQGTESDPFLISSRAHLEELAKMVNGGTTYEGYHFKLTADLTGITTIIGNAEAFFSGIFDGDGHTVELNINSIGDYAGVFGNLHGATVKNTKVNGRIVAPFSYFAGGICGYASNSTISNCYNTVSISSSRAGGICGQGGTISNCYNTGSISASIESSIVGGICGQSGTISNCYNTGSISASIAGSIAGGICGSDGTISNCYNTGNISASSYAGGICGSNGRVISNCFAANATITATNSSDAGRIEGSGRGGITNCHALTSMKLNDLEQHSMNAGSKDGADSEEADFKNKSWLTSVLEWDFETVWTIGSSGWPILKGMDEPTGNLSPEMPLPEVVLYPNPATDGVYIRSDRPVSQVEIYSMSGVCVWRTGDFTGKADVSGLESGVYAVQIYTSPSPQTKLLIIRK
jgi:hypothetical protein